ncbi:MAG TPA: DNA repair protein RecO [Polyangia bacterium]|nr:DNA repair protein RecO [Polyangia bacterium]
MSSLVTPAIVLRVVNYGESDRIVTLFGRDTGRVSALARGARKSQRRFAGGLSLCAVGSAALRERPGAELATLERFDATESHAALGSDVARMAHAAYAAELVGKLCAPHQSEPNVFDWLTEFLRLLDGAGASAERLRVFEIGLLGGLGFGPVLDSCAGCAGASFAGRAPADVAFRWDPDRGGAVCSACARGGRPLPPAVREALIRLAGTSLADAAAAALPTDVNRDCREALLEIINHHVSGPLKTVEFIAKVARAGGQP